MKRLSLVISVILMCLMSFAGDIKHISITHEYISDNPNETPEQAEQSAIFYAQQKALEEHFGLDVVGINSTLQQQRTEGQDAYSSSNVFSLRETSVRGEWIETIKQRIIEKTFENFCFTSPVFLLRKSNNGHLPIGKRPLFLYCFNLRN